MIELKELEKNDAIEKAVESLKSKEFVLENVIPTLEFKNRPNRETAIKDKYLNMNIVYKIPAGDLVGEGGESFVVVDDGLLEMAHVELSEMRKAALENNKKQGYIITEFGPLTVLTSENGIYGAAKVLINEALLELKDRFDGESFYLLPSSVHEFIAVETGVEAENLRETVRTANDTVVDETDLLSYSVYMYDADTDELKIA